MVYIAMISSAMVFLLVMTAIAVNDDAISFTTRLRISFTLDCFMLLSRNLATQLKLLRIIIIHLSAGRVSKRCRVMNAWQCWI